MAKHGEVAFEYDCISAAVNPERIGTPQIFSELLDEFHPPSVVSDVLTQYSDDGNSKGTTIFGEWLEGSFSMPVISGDRLDIAMEFLESISAEREFVARTDQLPGVMRPLRIFIPSARYSLTRLRNCDKYALTLSYRTLKEQLAREGSSVLLTSGVRNNQSFGSGSVGVPVNRFASYVFDGADRTRSVAYTLQADSEVVVTLNGKELDRHTGPTVLRIIPLASDDQRLGSNALRFECREITPEWSVRNVSVT